MSFYRLRPSRAEASIGQLSIQSSAGLVGPWEPWRSVDDRGWSFSWRGEGVAGEGRGESVEPSDDYKLMTCNVLGATAVGRSGLMRRMDSPPGPLNYYGQRILQRSPLYTF